MFIKEGHHESIKEENVIEKKYHLESLTIIEDI